MEFEYREVGVVLHTCKPNTMGAEAGEYKNQDNLGYTARYYLKKHKYVKISRYVKVLGRFL